MERSHNWDCMLPYALFAYQEVPQATIGFSLFDLLYGHVIYGPLDVLMEEWIQSHETENDILTYVMEVRDWIESAREIAQDKQKEYYNQKT